MFEYAAKNKLRWKYNNGVWPTEDLWDFKIEDLYDLLDFNLEKIDKASFNVSRMERVKSKNNLSRRNNAENEVSVLSIRINIINHIIEDKIKEYEEKENKVLNDERKKVVMGILADKQDEGLRQKSIEELQELLKDM